MRRPTPTNCPGRLRHRVFAASAVTALLAACSGTNGSNGHNALVETTTISPGPTCLDGGTLLQIGEDTNGNGTLDPSEVTSSVTVCNGAPGATGLTGPADTGATGATGPTGQRIVHGSAAARADEPEDATPCTALSRLMNWQTTSAQGCRASQVDGTLFG